MKWLAKALFGRNGMAMASRSYRVNESARRKQIACASKKKKNGSRKRCGDEQSSAMAKESNSAGMAK